jgi:hypothetical protein
MGLPTKEDHPVVFLYFLMTDSSGILYDVHHSALFRRQIEKHGARLK